jgi:hypothetical protein
VNFFFILHFILWFFVGKFNNKEKMIVKGFYLPVSLLMLFLLFPFASNLFAYFYIDLISGTIWVNACFLIGILPIATRSISIIFKMKMGEKFDDSILIVKSRRKKSHKEKSAGEYVVGTFWWLLILLMIVLVSPKIINGVQYLLVDTESNLIATVDGITNGLTNDADKVDALLSWFDRGEGKCENMANIYYRKKQSDTDILLKFGEACCIYSKYPYFCYRGGDDFAWVFVSRCGMCQEYSTLFSKMADAAGLEVRKIICDGEDHVWNEVKIDDDWIVIDATAVNLPLRTGFNLSLSFMEDKVKGDLRREGIMVDNGNVSYVYAVPPDGSKKKIDVTNRYTDVVNISIYVYDNNNEPVSNASVSVSSHNRLKKRSTGLKNITNEFGQCNFTIGGGKYTFTIKKNDYTITKNGTYPEDMTIYTEKILFNQSISELNRLEHGESVREELIIQMLGLIGAIFLSVNVLIGRKGRTKLHNWLANHISLSRSNERRFSAKFYEKLFWGWEQIFGIIGLMLLLTALIWTVILFFMRS